MPTADPVEAALRPSTKPPGHHFGLPAAPTAEPPRLGAVPKLPTAPGVRARLPKPTWLVSIFSQTFKQLNRQIGRASCRERV